MVLDLSNYIFDMHSLYTHTPAKPCLAIKEWTTGIRYKEFTKCTTDAAANSIITHVDNTDDMFVKIQLMNYSTGDVIAREFWYHLPCLREIIRQKMRKNKDNKEKMMLTNSDSNVFSH